jgi:hypothetical protein
LTKVVVKNLERRSFDYREFAARCGAPGNKIWAGNRLLSEMIFFGLSSFSGRSSFAVLADSMQVRIIAQ